MNKILKVALIIIICFVAVFLAAYLSSDSTTPYNETGIITPEPEQYNIAPPTSAPAPSAPENEDADLIRKMNQ